MANRNKRGKLHSVFSQEFDVTFFYKPAAVTYEYMYYIVLEDIIFLQARFIDNAVLIIDNAKSLTTSMVSKHYNRLVELLKQCETFTTLVSAIGCCQELIQACMAGNVPAVECQEFLLYPSAFYTKYKTWTHNDESRFGFYLLSLDEKSFKEIRDVRNGCGKMEVFDFHEEPIEPPKVEVPKEEPVEPKKEPVISSFLVPFINELKKDMPDIIVAPNDIDSEGAANYVKISEPLSSSSNHSYNALSFNARINTTEDIVTGINISDISGGCMVMKYINLMNRIHKVAKESSLVYTITGISRGSTFHDIVAFDKECEEIPGGIFSKLSYIIK